MLRKYVEQIMNLYNYIDGIVVVNAEGVVEYYTNFRPDVNNLTEKDALGKHILTIYPTLTEESSSIMRVLESGKPIANEFQVLTTYKGQRIKAVNTTMPIRDQGAIIGAVDVSRYIDSPFERQGIMLSLKERGGNSSLYTVDDIITTSKELEALKDKIPMIADTDSSVLIYGETGTGKELVAQSLHTGSRRRSKRFVSQNCAAIPDTLLESILFGTVKGSYTGAENRPGLFELADGGTLFLDEINSMELSMQTKLLKAIEEKQITRIGGITPVPIDVKIISAINENPLHCLREKRLREDLFYRLSVVQLTVPPLRERDSDLLYLTDHFVRHYNEKMNRNILGVDEEVERLFQAYRWPGNVRELKNVVEGAFNVASSRFIRKNDLPEYLLKNVNPPLRLAVGEWLLAEPDFTLDRALRQFEQQLLRCALDTSQSQVEAAKQLGISKQSLNYKLNKYGML